MQITLQPPISVLNVKCANQMINDIPTSLFFYQLQLCHTFGPKTGNILPAAIRNSATIEEFKISVKRYLFIV